MTPTERIAKPVASSKAGLFAPLRALLRLQGSAAHSRTATVLASTGLASLCAVAGLLALFSAPAQAAFRHEYLSPITEVPASSGAPVTGPFSSPWGLGVDAAGDVYISDTGTDVIDKFDSSNAFLSQFGGGGGEGASVAVNNATGEVYVSGVGGVVNVFSPAGALLATWNGSDTPQGSFTAAGGGLVRVAFDNSKSPADPMAGDVYVSNQNAEVIDVFKPESGGNAEYLAQFGTGYRVFDLAVDGVNGDVLAVTDAPPAAEAVEIFAPIIGPGGYERTGEILGPPGGQFSQIHEPFGVSVAADSSTGDIYVSDRELKTLDQFSATGTYVGQITGTSSGPFGAPDDLAVGADGDVYVADATAKAVDVFGPDLVIPDVVLAPVSNLKGRSVTLNGTVNPDAEGEPTCSFEYGTTTSYGQTVECSEHVPGSAESPVPVTANVEGLQADTTYHFRLLATNTNGTNTSQDGEFKTSGQEFDNESVAQVTADSVTFDAVINPNGAETHYYFEYGASALYGADAPVPLGAALAGTSAQSVSVTVLGLQTNTTYHYRVVASSEYYTVEGPDQTFTTQSGPGPSGLPDGRQWELVSPPDKHGAQVEPINEQGVVQAAQDGEAFTFVTDIPTEAEPAGYQYKIQNFARRAAGGGWSSQDIETPHQETQGNAVGQGLEYRAFSADLSQAIVEPLTQRFEALSGLEVAPLASERTAYLRADFACTSTPACFTPLLTTADVTSGAKIEGSNEAYEGEAGFVGANASAGDVLLHSNVGLTAEAGDTGGLYEWQGGTVRHVSAASAGNVSADGSRVLWGASESEGESRLYDWDRASGRSVRLDLPQGVPPAGTPDALLQGESTDGSLVFFSDSQALLPGADGTDLYVCEVSEAHGELACALRDLTVDANAGEAAGVFGTSPGVSEDGSYVYFMATGVLAPGAVAGAGNMYVVHRSGAGWGAPALVTVMAYAPGNTCQEEDGHDWTYKADCRTARVSPNGQWLAFMSDESLTGYDMHDASSGVSDQEVYLYSAAAGRLVCASCNPSGARPHGVQDGSVESAPLFTGQEAWGYGTWFAGSVPGWTPYAISRGAIYQSRYLSNSGRLFFDSSDALLPQDTNNAMDVYELEPPGVGSCHEGAAGWDEPAGGCLGLISSGVSGEESVFLDASESGSDVFFMTSQRLVPEDVDDSYDVYDAHECTPAAPCRAPVPAPPRPCTTETSCRPAPSAQPEVFAAPASAVFTGPGDQTPPPVGKPRTAEQLRVEKLARALKACRKKPRGRRRALCERSARKTYAKKASARRSSKAKPSIATNDRRASR